DVVARPNRRDPPVMLDHLEAGLGLVEVREDGERGSERPQRDEEGPSADQTAALSRNQREEDRPAERDPQRPREEVVQCVLPTSRPTSITPPASTASAYVRTRPVWTRRTCADSRAISFPTLLTIPSIHTVSTTNASALATSLPTPVNRN